MSFMFEIIGSLLECSEFVCFAMSIEGDNDKVQALTYVYFPRFPVFVIPIKFSGQDGKSIMQQKLKPTQVRDCQIILVQNTKTGENHTK
jgi:hypothetical protein